VSNHRQGVILVTVAMAEVLPSWRSSQARTSSIDQTTDAARTHCSQADHGSARRRNPSAFEGALR
jgi:hypothetical protein